jgi:flavin-dependent dehydrogenase
VCTRESASAIAARAYFRVPPALAREVPYLAISYDKAICPGYGWVFPGPDRLYIYNLGVGVFLNDKDTTRQNVRDVWSTFLERFPLAARIAREGEPQGELKGAPLRTAMRGAALFRKGLLVIGEAAGLTFSFSGEGIGKALESGIIAADLIEGHFSAGTIQTADVGAEYARTLGARFGSMFRSYERVQRWLRWPSVCNFIAWRAAQSAFVRTKLEGVLAETVDPGTAFSVRGFVRAMTKS